MRSLVAALLLCVSLCSTVQARLHAAPGAVVVVDRHAIGGPAYGVVEKQENPARKKKKHPVTITALESRQVIHKRSVPKVRAVSAADEAGIIVGARALMGVVEIAAAPLALLERARQYLGTNPTGWRSLWCARFMALIAPKVAQRVRNPNWARDWAKLPHTDAKIGAIVVLTRGRGGHIGVVKGFTRKGDPIVISGNHGRKVGVGVYPARRVLAYVEPSA